MKSKNSLSTIEPTAQAATVKRIRSSIGEQQYESFISYVDAAPATTEAYGKAVRLFINWLSSQGISQPKRADIIKYRDAVSVTHKATTVQTYMIAIRQFFKWLEQERIYPNVAENVKGVKISREHKKDALTPAQVRDILATLKAKIITTPSALRDYAIIALTVTGGLRTIEVERANVEDLRTLGSYSVLYIQGKGRSEKADYIKVTPDVERVIRAYLSTREGLAPDSPLFASESDRNGGGRLTTRSISRLIKNAFVAAGYNSDRLTAHSLRHTAVTMALVGGMTLQEAQQFARHSNVATTTIYAHNLERLNNRCEETIAATVFGA